MKVVGVSFVPTYPENLYQLQALYDWQADQAKHGFSATASMAEIEPLSVVLKRNPGNQHDRNAVEVHVPALGDDGRIGHLARDNAAIVAPMMDNGVRFACHVHRCRVLQSDPSKPGIDISITRLKKDQP